MASTLGNGNITFGDGTIQSTKTPTVVSAFTNDSGFITNASVSSTYATIGTAVSAITSGGAASSYQLNWYNQNGSLIGSNYWNCNCNC